LKFQLKQAVRLQRVLTGRDPEGSGTADVWTPELGAEDPCPVVNADKEGIDMDGPPSDIVAVID